MGLIQAFKGAAGGELADQYLEYFVCDSLSDDVLLARGVKKSSSRSSNNGNPEVINNGAGVVVHEGQCALIVSQGTVAEVCAEPGIYTYNSSTECSVFSGNLGQNILQSFKQFGRRFAHGGEVPTDQRVYYVNIKEIMNNKFGTSNPLPFRVIDARTGIDFDLSVRCFGSYTFRIDDPIIFYRSVSGNMKNAFTRSLINEQLREELLNGLIPAFNHVAALGVRYSEIGLHTNTIRDQANESLKSTWYQNRGILLVSLAFNSIDIPPEDLDRIKDIQTTAVYTNQSMLGAKLGLAQAEALTAAASNENAGPMMAFAGMNMSAMAGANTGFAGMMANGQGIPPVTPNSMPQQPATAPTPAPAPSPAPAATPMAPKSQTAPNGWNCSCGTENTGKFCKECGQPKPVVADGWNCPGCQTLNKGKFCMECGTKKPADALLYKCDKCGWEPEDPANPPKFCPECGDPFGDEDVVS